MSRPALPNRSTVVLEELACALCCGEGAFVSSSGPGRFDDLLECWMPEEDIEPCPVCRGTGVTYRAHLAPPSSVPPERAMGDEEDLPF